MIWLHLLSFLLGFCGDALWVFYNKATQRDQVAKTVLWSMSIHTLAVIGFSVAFSQKELFIGLIFGGGAGTYVAMAISKSTKGPDGGRSDD